MPSKQTGVEFMHAPTPQLVTGAFWHVGACPQAMPMLFGALMKQDVESGQASLHGVLLCAGQDLLVPSQYDAP